MALATDDPVKIGVLAKRGPEQCLEKWSPTADYLSAGIPGKSFVIIPLDHEKIYPSIERGEIDLFWPTRHSMWNWNTGSEPTELRL